MAILPCFQVDSNLAPDLQGRMDASRILPRCPNAMVAEAYKIMYGFVDEEKSQYAIAVNSPSRLVVISATCSLARRQDIGAQHCQLHTYYLIYPNIYRRYFLVS